MTTITKRTALLLALVTIAACGGEADDVTQIEQLMRATWDRPDAPLSAGPIAVHGDYAIADWTQGATGGRALLVRRERRWLVSLCSGDGIRTASGLRSVGLPAAVAAELADDLARLERDVDQERLRAMSAFAGIVRME